MRAIAAKTSSFGTHRFVEHVVDQLLAWRRQGIDCALVTLVGVDGSSPRPVGSQMAVSERGDWVGNITSGCAEAAVVATALETLAARRPRLERYGRGSRYVDIQLPCGSGISIYYDPLISTDTLAELSCARARRQPVALSFAINPDGADQHMIVPVALSGPRDEARWRERATGDGAQYHRLYAPPLRVDIAGRGPAVTALASLSSAIGWSTTVASPDTELLRALEGISDGVHEISLPGHFDGRFIDGWTASALLFHDHDWEPIILKRILAGVGFYVGALGSRRTHTQRLDALVELGCSAQEIMRVRGPIGLDIGALNPPEIALSILGEILATARGGG